MTLPTTATLNTYGAALKDYSPVIDATTDRPAAGANNAYNDVAMMSGMCPRAWAQIKPAGAGSPTLQNHFAMWGGAVGVAPVVARTGVGIYTVTWPTTITDFIPSGLPGFNGNITVSFRTGWGQQLAGAGSGVVFSIQCQATSANVITVNFQNNTPALADPNGPTFDIFGF